LILAAIIAFIKECIGNFGGIFYVAVGSDVFNIFELI
jgi:hypothetical protein